MIASTASRQALSSEASSSKMVATHASVAPPSSSSHEVNTPASPKASHVPMFLQAPCTCKQATSMSSLARPKIARPMLAPHRGVAQAPPRGVQVLVHNLQAHLSLARSMLASVLQGKRSVPPQAKQHPRPSLTAHLLQHKPRPQSPLCPISGPTMPTANAASARSSKPRLSRKLHDSSHEFWVPPRPVWRFVTHRVQFTQSRPERTHASAALLPITRVLSCSSRFTRSRCEPARDFHASCAYTPANCDPGTQCS